MNISGYINQENLSNSWQKGLLQTEQKLVITGEKSKLWMKIFSKKMAKLKQTNNKKKQKF